MRMELKIIIRTFKGMKSNYKPFKIPLDGLKWLTY